MAEPQSKSAPPLSMNVSPSLPPPEPVPVPLQPGSPEYERYERMLRTDDFMNTPEEYRRKYNKEPPPG
jgi:hypothetical protein